MRQTRTQNGRNQVKPLFTRTLHQTSAQLEIWRCESASHAYALDRRTNTLHNNIKPLTSARRSDHETLPTVIAGMFTFADLGLAFYILGKIRIDVWSSNLPSNSRILDPFRLIVPLTHLVQWTPPHACNLMSTKPTFVKTAGRFKRAGQAIYVRHPHKYLRWPFIHSVFCLTTGPKPPPKRCLHIVRSRVSSFKWEYPLLSLRSSSSFLRLLATSISPFIFPSITTPT